MNKTTLIVSIAAALALGVVAGSWWQTQQNKAELAALNASVAAAQQETQTLMQALNTTQKKAALSKKRPVPTSIATVSVGESSASQGTANASVETSDADHDEAPDAPTLSHDQQMKVASSKLSDYLLRTAEADLRTRWRQGRQLLEELRELGPGATEALQEALAEATTSRERATAATLLGGMQDPIAIPTLETLLVNEDDVIVRRAAARGLRLMESEEAIPILEAIVETDADDRFVRFNAALGLAQLGESGGVESLVDIFDETASDGAGRFWVFRALTRLDDRAALPAMRQVIHDDSDASYQVRALEFIARHGDAEDSELVKATLDRPAQEKSIIEAAQKALVSLSSGN
ncbi:MAG: HEAT repeat domain-containing protein [Pseudomonadota bacterium]